jgi:hypothetical protein
MSDFDVSLTPAAAINVTVSGGVGPAGAAGAGGVATLQGLTGALTLAAVGGTWTAAGSTITLTVSSASVAWADITGKPATFAPSAHTHVVADVTGLQAALDGKQAAGSYAAASHTHTAGQVTGLATVATTGAYADLSGAPAAYSLPTATASVLGGVKIGSGLSIDGSGVVTAAGTYTLPAATVSTLGGVIVGTGLAVTSGTISVSYGTSSSTACVGNDARLSDARTPTAHTQAFSTITSTPTTLAGYGITDAAPARSRRFAWASPYSYSGRAATGSATSDSVWTIKRSQVSTSGAITATLTATNVAWDNYASASYS